MAQLILVKHSMPMIDPDVPAKSWRLSADGEARCQWLARELAKFAPASLYSSVEEKARDTARLVGLELGLIVKIVDGLHENDRTSFPHIEDKGEFEQRFRTFFDNPDSLVIGNETANQALHRFRCAITEILESETDQSTTCVIAHGTVISLFVSRFNPVSAFEIWSTLNPLPAYIAVDVADYRITNTVKGYPVE